jgi:hypothetical protein
MSSMLHKVIMMEGVVDTVAKVFSIFCVSASALYADPCYSQSNPAILTVVDACTVAGDACRSAMLEYMRSLRADNATEEQYDQIVADTVVTLATAAQEDGTCNDSNKGLAQAIAISGTFANAGQRDQISSIAAAVELCDEFEIASLAPAGNAPPASAF